MDTTTADRPADETTEPTTGSRRWRWVVAIASVPVLAIAWWLARPALVDDRVDTSFDVSIEDAADRPEPNDPMDGLPFPDEADADAAMADDEGQAIAEDDGEAMADGAPAEPVLLASGEFIGLDNHDASGQAAIFELPDGTRVIRLENLDADNGPGLELHLVAGADQTRPSDVSRIAPLQGNQGNQTYELPEDVVIPVDATVLIWCVPFRTAVGGATLG